MITLYPCPLVVWSFLRIRSPLEQGPLDAILSQTQSAPCPQSRPHQSPNRRTMHFSQQLATRVQTGLRTLKVLPSQIGTCMQHFQFSDVDLQTANALANALAAYPPKFALPANKNIAALVFVDSVQSLSLRVYPSPRPTPTAEQSRGRGSFLLRRHQNVTTTWDITCWPWHGPMAQLL